MEGTDVFAQYVDPQYRDLVPQFVMTGDGKTRLLVDDTFFPVVPLHPGFPRKYPDNGMEEVGLANDATQRLKYMDDIGIDVQVIFPSLSLAGVTTSVRDPGLAGALCRAYNRHIGEFTSADPNRLRGVMIVPGNHPEVAAEELRFGKEQYGLSSFGLNPTPADGIPWSDHRYDPLWRTAEELGITVLFHEVTTGYTAEGVGALRYTANWPMIYFCSHTVEPMLTIADLIFGGVAGRFPNLKFAFAEAHVSWLPGWLSLMDQNEPLAAREIPGKELLNKKLAMHPSDYFNRQFFLMAFPDDRMIHEALQAAPNSIVLSSDWPHGIQKVHNTDGIFSVRNRTDLTDEDRDALLRHNPARLFGA
jgi:predicted TIM-barrel fold metal-dependent hydrolase